MNEMIEHISIEGKTYDLPQLPKGGDEGQVLTKSTDTGYQWKYYTPKIWKGTLTEYASILNKEDDCLYFIVEDNINADIDDFNEQQENN